MKAAASRTGKKRSYWKRPRQPPWEEDDRRVVRGKLRWEEGCAVLHCWERAPKTLRSPWQGSRPSREATTSSGWGAEKKTSKTPPSTGKKKKKRREKEGERRWGVCGRVRRRENASGPGVSNGPCRGQAAPGATGWTKASPTECYQVRKFLIFFTELRQES